MGIKDKYPNRAKELRMIQQGAPRAPWFCNQLFRFPSEPDELNAYIHKSTKKNLVSEVPSRAPKNACQTKVTKLELPISIDE
jgi:hypothetical protein